MTKIYLTGEMMKRDIKLNLLKVGTGALFIGALYCNNEQKWQKRLAVERANFEMQKNLLEQKIDELQNRDTSFRFYEHFANGADYREIRAIEEMRFINTKENPYAIYKPQKLTAELIEKNDTALKEHLHDSELFLQQQNAAQAFENSDSLSQTLKNGNLYLRSTLNIMTKHNRAMGGSLVRALENSDEQNEREFKIRYMMFTLKTKNKMYFNQHDLTTDFYKALFLKNLALYKKTEFYLTSLTDSLEAVHRLSVARDSVAFEKDKRHKIDSILNAKPDVSQLRRFDYAVDMPVFMPKRAER